MSYVNPCNNSMVIPPISIAEVTQVISSLKKSSAGVSQICFRKGTFPTELKLARVVPIFKSGDSAVLCNYRPISILSFLQKYLRKYCLSI